MSGIGSIIYPVIIGYLSLVISRTSKYRSLRMTGPRLILASAVEGYLIYALVFWVLIKPFNWFFEKEIKFDSFEMFTVCFVVLVLIQIEIWIRTARNTTSTLEYQKEAALVLGDYIEYLVVDAIMRDRYVEMVLKNREVFVGYPIHSPERTVDDTSIAIVPVRIGYKSEEDFSTSFRIEMSDGISKLRVFTKKTNGNKNSDHEFQIAISKCEIVHLTTYDKAMYEAFAKAVN